MPVSSKNSRGPFPGAVRLTSQAVRQRPVAADVMRSSNRRDDVDSHSTFSPREQFGPNACTDPLSAAAAVGPGDLGHCAIGRAIGHAVDVLSNSPVLQAPRQFRRAVTLFGGTDVSP